MSALPGGAYGFLAVSIVAFIVLGSVLEGIPAIVLFGPLLFPIAKAAGVHEVHYAMVVIFSMGIGLFAPPFGVGYYGACAVSKVNPDEGIRHIWGYIGAMLVGLVIVAAFPWFSTGFLESHAHPNNTLTSPEPTAMSRFLGEIRQLGYVVHDIEAAMDYWSTTLGVGPGSTTRACPSRTTATTAKRTSRTTR